MDPLLIFSIIGLVISISILIYGVRGYFRGRKLINEYMESVEKYFR